jgi:polysaccharide pyruvyl transferase WcaK-like protein
MSVPRILLVGYSGKGNFGDDLLLSITYNLLRNIFHSADIYAMLDVDKSAYVQTLLQGIKILKPTSRGQFDFIIHGGGGVFFDEKIYGKFSQWLDIFIRRLGYHHYVRAEKLLRRILHKPRISASCRLGIGIGVDLFSVGSKKLLRDSLPILASFQALWLRYTKSIKNLEHFSSAIKAELVLGSDLAFLTDYWLPSKTKKQKSTRPRLGIILRDRADNNIPMLKKLIEECAIDYDITGFVFEKDQDVQTIALLATYSTHIWQPELMTVAHFIGQMAQQDVLLTSRAHGAICGACVGVPSVVVNIAHKLEQVHQMLPNSTLLVPSNDSTAWKEVLQKAQAIKPEMIAGDVKKNCNASENAWKEIQQWIN